MSFSQIFISIDTNLMMGMKFGMDKKRSRSLKLELKFVNLLSLRNQNSRSILKVFDIIKYEINHRIYVTTFTSNMKKYPVINNICKSI